MDSVSGRRRVRNKTHLNIILLVSVGLNLNKGTVVDQNGTNIIKSGFSIRYKMVVQSSSFYEGK